MKKFICIALALAILVMSGSFSAYAEQMTTPERLGQTNTYYYFNETTKALTINGTGATPNFSSNGASASPWIEWCDEIESVVVENGVTTLGNNLLYQLVNATSIVLPDTLTSIGSYALSRTFSITEWDIPFGVKSISTCAFDNCSNLVRINLPDTLVSIGSSAFANCSSLESIVIPYSVKTIGVGAFQNCTSLSNVQFQDLTSSVELKNNVFLACSALKSIKMPANAVLGRYSYGYKSASASNRYRDVTMQVYEESPAFLYAESVFNYTLYDTIPVECAVGYNNVYNYDNINSTYTYTFTPQHSSTYNLYTLGDCDVNAVLYYGDSIIASSDDISTDNTNFCISTALQQGGEYRLVVSSVRSTGNYTLWIYPDNVTGVCAFGSVTASAQPDMTTVDDGLLSGLILTVSFDTGLVDKMYYNTEYFNKSAFSQLAQPLYCGENTAYVRFGNNTAAYDLMIEHNYLGESLDYTVDEDGCTRYTCVLCADGYDENIIPTPAVKIRGTCVLSENKSGAHMHNTPYSNADILVIDDEHNRRSYSVSPDGSWQVNTFTNCEINFVNPYGKNVSLYIDVSECQQYEIVEHGYVSLIGYDFNSDGVYNVQDVAIYSKQYKKRYGNDYMQYFANFA